MLKDSHGRISLKALIWILVLAFALYSGYKLSFPYLSYYMLRTDVEDELRLAHMYSDATLRKRIAEKAATWSVPITTDDIVISRDFDTLTISLGYAQKVTFLGKYTKKLVFNIKASGPVRDPSGVLR